MQVKIMAALIWRLLYYTTNECEHKQVFWRLLSFFQEDRRAENHNYFKFEQQVNQQIQLCVFGNRRSQVRVLSGAFRRA